MIRVDICIAGGNSSGDAELIIDRTPCSGCIIRRRGRIVRLDLCRKGTARGRGRAGVFEEYSQLVSTRISGAKSVGTNVIGIGRDDGEAVNERICARAIIVAADNRRSGAGPIELNKRIGICAPTGRRTGFGHGNDVAGLQLPDIGVISVGA